MDCVQCFAGQKDPTGPHSCFWYIGSPGPLSLAVLQDLGWRLDQLDASTDRDIEVKRCCCFQFYKFWSVLRLKTSMRTSGVLLPGEALDAVHRSLLWAIFTLISSHRGAAAPLHPPPDHGRSPLQSLQVRKQSCADLQPHKTAQLCHFWRVWVKFYLFFAQKGAFVVLLQV